jgi:plastocyanin
MLKQIFLISAFVAMIAADCYMQNPRGSNDREREENTNRNNANRLFDSQNNGQGGYCWGPSMSFYAGSQLSIEWTQQHGCGRSPKQFCNIVLQYLCQPKNAPNNLKVRDGYTTDTIPQDAAGYSATDPTDPTRLLYGMHESWDTYLACQSRNRNMGLWISDREQQGGLNAGRASAIFTRQNNNGDRHGYECTEERDYYPYWHPSQWRDIAILTHDTTLCPYYQQESQNVKPRGWCQQPATAANQQNQYAKYNTQTTCQMNQFTWVTSPAWNIPAPDCVIAPFGRDNHLGNGLTGYANSYNWTLPTASMEACIANNNCDCVLRIRYNISTYDMGGAAAHNPTPTLDWTNNGAVSPVKNNPTLYQDKLPFTLAMNTNQFGRTFQDRTHVFSIINRPSGVSDSVRIQNLNVRGKRGNIVQTYPATEYDFVPEILVVRVGDLIHFQWTGCDHNPAGNAGEGTAQTDRSNIVQITNMGKSTPATDADFSAGLPYLFPDDSTRKYMSYLGQTGCKTMAQLLADQAATGTATDQNKANCMKLNAASPYFNGGLVKMNTSNEYYYMSSRNNNFTNRGQKAYLKVAQLLPTWALVVVVSGLAVFGGSGVLAGMVFYAKHHPEWATGAKLLNSF